MDLKEQLLKEHSSDNRDHIIDWIGKDTARLDELVNLFLHSEEYRVNQRAAWPLLHFGLKNKEMIRPYFVKMIDNLKTTKNEAVIRNTLRVLQDEVIPEEKEGELYEICFNYLVSMKQPIAIKVFGMTVLCGLAQKFPELKEELIAEIEYQYPHGSKGFQSRGRKILKILKKKETH